MERYDNIEYNFEENNPFVTDDSVQTTDKDGYITSQQYIPDRNEVTENPDSENYDYTENSEKRVRKKRERDKNAPRETVLVFQLTVCIIVAIVAYILKSMGGTAYENLREIYYVHLNNSIIIDTGSGENYNFIRDTANELNSR